MQWRVQGLAERLKMGMSKWWTEIMGVIGTADALKVWRGVEEGAVAHIAEGSDGDAYTLVLVLD